MDRIPLWIDLRHVAPRRRIPYLRAAQRVQADAILVAPDDPEAGRDDVVVADGTRLLRGGRSIGTIVAMEDAAAQQAAMDAPGTVLVEGRQWTIIPLENLIAARSDRPGTLFALARTPEQAGVFRDTLEHGVHGVVLAPAQVADVEATDILLRSKGLPRAAQAHATQPAPRAATQAANAGKPAKRRKEVTAGKPAEAGNPATARKPAKAAKPAEARKEATAWKHAKPGTHTTAGKQAVGAGRDEAHGDATGPTFFLEPARIVAVDDAGPGDRVCIDTTSAFHPGEGLLVGSTARSFVLVHAETLETEFVAPRPFRVNAGALHSYVLAEEGRTRYLSELAAGSRVVAVDADGHTRLLTVGRAKLERRPHLLVCWRGPSGEGSAVLQNAETIRLVRPGGEAVAVTELRPGDEVLVHPETAARHFGMAIDEKLEER